MMTFKEIVDNFSILDDWEDRYRYLIELGRSLPVFPEEARIEANKVQGCASQVWLVHRVIENDEQPSLVFQGDSDAHLVRGLVAILLALYSGKTAHEILSTDALAVLSDFGLKEHLSPQRSNGLHAMVARIQHDARCALAA